MPGAFAYHLHSFSACTLRSATNHWVGPLLAKGATATMGCTAEPYLAGTPDLAVFCARLLYNGFTFGEAACASQPVLSWQTTVVGDPLYRPFGKDLDMMGRIMELRHSKLLDWFYLRLVNLNLANGKPLAAGSAVLEQLELTKHSAVLSEKLGDLYAAQGKPASAVFAYQQALQQDPSPQQRVRLLLNLAERQASLDHLPEAYAAYQKLLYTFPDFPDQLAIYRRLLPLAQQLDKPADAKKYQAEIQRLTPPPPKS
jgi:tetratricopeptide (TPR) repeat protein